MSTDTLKTSVPEEQVGNINAEDIVLSPPPATVTDAEELDGASPQVDFSDEEAAAAADAPEFDLGEHNDEVDSNQAEESPRPEGSTHGETVNYNEKNKGELVAIFASLLENKPVQTIRRDADAIKVAFYKVHRADGETKKAAFIAAGGNPEEYTPEIDPSEVKLKELFARYREKRNEYLARLDEDKDKNLKAKLQIIEELKELIGSNETLNHTFSQFRELQQRWKNTGAVPQSDVKDIWETYNLYVESFYNYIKINKELKDLDLKKNYEAKLQLCEEAELLMLDPSIVNAFQKLQKLHDRWRETGPVADEYKEQLWERFRDASSKINKRHQEYFETAKEEQNNNLELKTRLCEKAEELASTPFTTRKEWLKASEELIKVQKVWKTIGFAPKKDNNKIYERFRTACDKFFENKRNFYLSLKTEMDHNYQLKLEICLQAEALKDSQEWKKATDEMIALQKKWKEIGPVPRRYSDAIWKRFRTACDFFFENKSTHFVSRDADFEDNLAKKREILSQIKNFSTEEGEDGFEKIKQLQRSWSQIGFVPIKKKDELQEQYRQAVDEVFAKLRGSDKDRKMERFKSKLQNNEGGDRRIRGERERLFNKLKQMEADVALLENNIGFFSKSKTSESFIRDVKDKISKMKEEMEILTEKISLIDGQGQ